MKHTIKNSLALLALMTIASCGGSKGGGGTPEEWKAPIKAPTKADKMKHFDEWKKKSFKYCDLNDAFGMDDEELRNGKAGLDMNLLIASNGDSAIFSDEDEGVAISSYEPLPGKSSNITTGTEFDAQAIRNGAHCIVTVDHKEVFRTLLADQIVITSHWGDAKPTSYSTVEDAIKKSLRPTDATIQFMGKLLKLSSEESKKYVKIVWSYRELLYRISEKYPWNSLYTNIENDYSIEVRTSIPELKGMYLYGKQLNFKDVGNLQFKYNVKAGVKPEVEFQKYLGIKPQSLHEATMCLKMMDLTQVSYEKIFSRCKILDPYVELVAEENGTMRFLTIKYFALKSPNINESTYYGFKNALKRQVYSQLLIGERIQDLDPNKETKIVAIIANQVEMAESLDVPELYNSRNHLIEIAIEWSFWSVNERGTDLNDVMMVAKQFGSAFPLSIRTMLSDLAGPNNYKAIETLKFTSSILDKVSYTEKVAKFIGLYRLSDSAKAKFVNNIFQDRVGHKELDYWISGGW